MWHNWKRFWLHAVAMTAIGCTALVSGWLCIGGVLMFIYYEMNEDRWRNDQAFIDVQGGIAGIPIAALIVWLVRTLC